MTTTKTTNLSNMTITIGDKIVTRVRLLGLDRYRYTAYEPSSLFGPHHTITHHEGLCYGRIGTRAIPTEVKAMAGGSVERVAACRAWRVAQAEEAYGLIREAFPEVLEASVIEYDGGEVLTGI
jgi:hypothetical protein